MGSPTILKQATLGLSSIGAQPVMFGDWLAAFDPTLTYRPANGNLIVLIGQGNPGPTPFDGRLGTGWHGLDIKPPPPPGGTFNCSSNFYTFVIWKIWEDSDTVGEIAFISTANYSIFEITGYDPMNPIQQVLCSITAPVYSPVTTVPITPDSIGMLPIFCVANENNAAAPSGPTNWTGATLVGYSYAVFPDDTPSIFSTAIGSITTDTITPISAIATLDSNNQSGSNPSCQFESVVILIGPGSGGAQTPSGPDPINPQNGFPVGALVNMKKAQTSSFLLQVFRNGNWIDIPVRSATGSIKKASAGQMTAVINDNLGDLQRSHLYEGEKIRAYKGTLGSGSVRVWTGFVDAPTVTDNGLISRSVVMTDNVQELNTAILLDGHVFDNIDPMYVAASCIQHAIDTSQYIPTDDSGNPLTGATASFSNPSGNALCYFPDLHNLDGSFFTMAYYILIMLIKDKHYIFLQHIFNLQIGHSLQEPRFMILYLR